MANTISYPSYNQTRNLTENIPNQYETLQDSFRVSEMDSQTAGKSTEYHVTQEVIDQVRDINLLNEASESTKFVVSYGRVLARSQ